MQTSTSTAKTLSSLPDSKAASKVQAAWRRRMHAIAKRSSSKSRLRRTHRRLAEEEEDIIGDDGGLEISEGHSIAAASLD